MDFEEAHATHWGIYFRVPKSKKLIFAHRDEEDKVVVTYPPRIEKESENLVYTLSRIIFIMVFSVIVAGILHAVTSQNLRIVLLMVAVWVGTFLYYYLRSKQKEEFKTYRYHGAEHKALNYLDRYQEAPGEVSFIKNTSMYSVRCGATIQAVFYALFTLCTLSIVFLPPVWLKIVGCIISLIVVFFLWAVDLLNFFQKFVVREPTWEETEVAYEGLKAYVSEIKKREGNHEESKI